ncbi:MAG: antitoxin [Deltaproteobacteria bacterium]|nr:antitoxin [Deltaproteobacteria bacterium]
MSKRLQVLMRDKEYQALQRLCRRQKRTVADWVRESIRLRLVSEESEPPERRIARVLAFARHSAPTGDIEQLLAEIERGRSA